MKARNVSLDVIRTIAITTVVIAHTVLAYGAPENLAPLQFGGTGVDLFFMLSGWLIGSQLYKELNSSNNINIIKFWTRRWMRTLPAYYVVLLFTIAQLTLTKNDFSIPYSYFFFTQNYQTSLPFFTISWSLCVEEQFYLVIAPLVLFSFKMAPNRQLTLLLVLLLLPSIFRELELFNNIKETHVSWDCCILGIILANIKHLNRTKWHYLSKYSSILFLCSVFLYLFFFANRWFPELNISDPSKLILSFIFSTWIIFVDNKNIKYPKIFQRLVIYISTRSYSIYLLHVEGFSIVNKFFAELSFFSFFILCTTATLILSEILYRIIEKPFMDLREKIKVSQHAKTNEVAKACL
ncbi:acyltransferase family protein [Thalassomonas sp. M1454]|uniref:acyltransferase family protein n=1 Tax=Thalassomonas sp. M1454 TaxID=2594477 RepID=UPI00117DC88D|nr:acyltransferase [Thalassomonas sp. M1454]TRX57937.1 acyltransferase [Thalassomonas sp. M1454]